MEPAPTGPLLAAKRERRQVRVTGLVQGVGFRPFVWRLADQLRLAGWVRNDAAGVEIQVEGEEQNLGRFLERLRAEAPPLACIDGLRVEPAGPLGLVDFRILESGVGPAATAVGPDVAVCGDCLAELFDPRDRRWRYPFINCTRCGPRFTISRGLPYDRSRTSMAAFPLCAECEREYRDPADRRFHAEPNACPACGPRLSLWEGTDRPLHDADPIAATLARLRAGQIVAVKGLGGFHLCCDATDAAAVARLRRRKAREAKPLAVMLANAASTRRYAELSAIEEAWLASPESPIALLEKRPGCDAALPGVAPGMAALGVMLPYAPLHYVLFHQAAGRPAGLDWLDRQQPLVLVMTSANPGGEPLAIDNAEAMRRLAGIADAFLLHDRDILWRCDDSVVQGEGRRARADRPVPMADLPRMVRRARGYAPRPVKLPRSGPAVLALGGALKNAICLTRADEAFLSPHIGDLDNGAACAALEEAAEHLLAMLEARPIVIAHDNHPDFFSTRLAGELASRFDVPALAVQHHHAHVAAVCAEHGVAGPVIGLALDGFGLGADGGLWGGELLRVAGAECRRLGHLRELPLPGGDQAAREPWRMAAAALFVLGRAEAIVPRFRHRPGAAAVARMLRQDVRCPPTSSAGRLFDAAAGLLGVRELAGFEGQAAMELEGLAVGHGPVPPLAGGWWLENGVLDFFPLLEALADCGAAAFGAALFHATLAAGLSEWVMEAALRQRIDIVVCGGGCFLNGILGAELARELGGRGLRVLTARAAPPNDGGLALGQAWVALQQPV